MEIWKDISGYNGKYQVSNTGRVRSFAKGKNNPQILKPYNTRGYCTVGLCDKNKRTTALVHRLVAMAFIPNPNNLKEVNHKDEDKQNNHVENLEWCSREYNMSYGTARLRQGISFGKPVAQCSLDGIVIAKYADANIASIINNLDPSSIAKCCNGKRKYTGGYSWKFIDAF